MKMLMKMKMLTMLFIIVISFLVINVEGAVVANFTVVYDYVASDEIVILQNAVEDVGFISQLQVKPISMQTDDVPNKPKNVTVRALSSTQLEVSWAEVFFNQSGLHVMGYTVFYKKILDKSGDWTRVTSHPNVQSLVLTHLSPFTTYTIRVVAFHQMGNGIASNFVDEKTMEGVPAMAPKKFTCVSNNPSSITMSWQLLESTLWNGLEKDYIVYYRLYYAHSGTKSEVYVTPSKRELVLEGLKQFTKYEIYIAARTKKGPGPEDWCVVETQEGVPSIGPPTVTWKLDPKRPLEAIINFKPIPEAEMNGIVLKYRVYYGVSKDGKDEIEYPEMMFFDVDNYTSQVVIKDFLKPYMQLTVQIAGMTSVGEGKKSDPIFVSSCNCPVSIYAAWFENKPYVYKINRFGEVAGIFPDYLDQMVKSLCGSCVGLKSSSNNASTLYWDRSKDGYTPTRFDEMDLKKKVANNVHMHVAMFGRSEIENFQSIYKFVSIINSPGTAFVIRDPVAELDKTAAIMGSLASCWPAVIVIAMLSLVAGIVVWTADCMGNAEQFPNHSFMNGVYHGAYWAFVTMTTVGYGDKTPRSFLAQSIAICWMLMGPIINGIVVGAITTSLTTINLEKDPQLYGCNTGAIANTSQYNLGVRRNAKMNKAGKQYKKVEELLEDLYDGVIDGVLIDSLVAADKADVIAQNNLKLSKIIPEASGWGIILSSDFLKMENDIRSYVEQTEDEVKAMVDNRTSGLTIRSKPPSTLDTGIVDPDAKTFKHFVYFGLAAFVLLSIFGLTFEYGYLKIRSRRIVPFSQEHRELLEGDLSDMIKKFCKETTQMINKKSSEQESELKSFFWKRGYSFGIDAWVKKKTMDQDSLKKQIRYDEIMTKDLIDAEFYEKQIKQCHRGKNIIGGAIRVKPAKDSKI